MHFGEKDFFLDESDRSVLSMKMMLNENDKKKEKKHVRFNLSQEKQ